MLDLKHSEQRLDINFLIELLNEFENLATLSLRPINNNEFGFTNDVMVTRPCRALKT